MSGDGGVIIEGKPEPNLFQRFVDEDDLLLGLVLETKEGREIYGKAAEDFGVEDIWLVYNTAYNALLDYTTETHSLTWDDAKIVAWAMVQKALTDLIHEELSR